MCGTDTGRVTAKEILWANSATPKVIFAIANGHPNGFCRARVLLRSAATVVIDSRRFQDRQTALLFLVLSGGSPRCSRFGLTFGRSTAVTGLSTFAACLGGKLWIL
jgi:hypothetical protein